MHLLAQLRQAVFGGQVGEAEQVQQYDALDTSILSVDAPGRCDLSNNYPATWLCKQWTQTILYSQSSIATPSFGTIQTSPQHSCSGAPRRDLRLHAVPHQPRQVLVVSSLFVLDPRISPPRQPNSSGVVTGQPPQTTTSSIAGRSIPVEEAGSQLLSSSAVPVPWPVTFDASQNPLPPTPRNSLSSPSAPTWQSNPGSQSTIISITSSPSAVPSSGSKSSAPSAGLIAGAVIGSIAVVVLTGIFILLYLRHRKSTISSKPTDTAPDTRETGDLPDYQLAIGQHKVEMATNANVWELQAEYPTPYGQGYGDQPVASGPWELDSRGHG